MRREAEYQWACRALAVARLEWRDALGPAVLKFKEDGDMEAFYHTMDPYEEAIVIADQTVQKAFRGDDP